jgi:hypothetical protein
LDLFGEVFGGSQTVEDGAAARVREVVEVHAELWFREFVLAYRGWDFLIVRRKHGLGFVGDEWNAHLVGRMRAFEEFHVVCRGLESRKSLKGNVWGRWF